MADPYAGYVHRVERLMVDVLRSWPDVGPLREVVEDQIRRGGRRLRPRLAFAVVEALDGDPERAVAGAAAVEFYHLASLVLDDVQDGSAVRRGGPSLHASTGVGVAVNVAAYIRSLSYHAVHRSPLLTPGERLEVHRELDEAATRLVLGQSADVGWNAGWFPDPRAYPYERVLEWKTGALFGCAAAVGAVASRAAPAGVAAARSFGTGFGALYQRVDDYLDTFGGGASGRPPLEDLRAGKLTGPVLALLDTLDGPAATAALSALAGGTGADVLPALMADAGVADRLRADLHDRAESLRRHRLRAPELSTLVDAVLEPVR